MAVRRIDNTEDFAIEYPRCREWLLKGIEYQIGKADEAELLGGLLERKYLLWTSEKGACVTSNLNVDGEELRLIYVAGGEAHLGLQDVLAEGLPMIEEDAKRCGQKGFLIMGRLGWKPVLAPFDFKVQSVNYYKEF